MGRGLDQRAERGRWRRDLTRESFESVLVEFYAWRELLWRVAVIPGPVVDSDLHRELRAGHTAWNQRLATIWLHAHTRVAACAYEVDHALSVLPGVALRETLTHADWVIRREPAQQAFDNLVDAMRRELGLPVMSVTRHRAADRLDAAKPVKNGEPPQAQP